ncbi:MAG: hypothetical protein WA140_07385, partial [Geobacteraceae bacterium]
ADFKGVRLCSNNWWGLTKSCVIMLVITSGYTIFRHFALKLLLDNVIADLNRFKVRIPMISATALCRFFAWPQLRGHQDLIPLVIFQGKLNPCVDRFIGLYFNHKNDLYKEPKL